MCRRHGRRMREWRAPSRDELLRVLEERQKDLEQDAAKVKAEVAKAKKLAQELKQRLKS